MQIVNNRSAGVDPRSEHTPRSDRGDECRRMRNERTRPRCATRGCFRHSPAGSRRFTAIVEPIRNHPQVFRAARCERRYTFLRSHSHLRPHPGDPGLASENRVSSSETLADIDEHGCCSVL